MAPASITNVRAVVVGVFSLILIYGGGTFLLNSMFHRPTDAPTFWRMLAPIFAIILWLFPGFMTGYIAKKLPLRHGLWLGTAAVGTIIVALTVLELLLRISTPLPLSLIVGFLIPIFGGSVLGVFIGNHFAKRRNAP